MLRGEHFSVRELYLFTYRLEYTVFFSSMNCAGVTFVRSRVRVPFLRIHRQKRVFVLRPCQVHASRCGLSYCYCCMSPLMSAHCSSLHYNNSLHVTAVHIFVLSVRAYYREVVSGFSIITSVLLPVAFEGGVERANESEAGGIRGGGAGVTKVKLKAWSGIIQPFVVVAYCRRSYHGFLYAVRVLSVLQRTCRSPMENNNDQVKSGRKAGMDGPFRVTGPTRRYIQQFGTPFVPCWRLLTLLNRCFSQSW